MSTLNTQNAKQQETKTKNLSLTYWHFCHSALLQLFLHGKVNMSLVKFLNETSMLRNSKILYTFFLSSLNESKLSAGYLGRICKSRKEEALQQVLQERPAHLFVRPVGASELTRFQRKTMQKLSTKYSSGFSVTQAQAALSLS